MLDAPDTVGPNSVDRMVSAYDSDHNQIVTFGGCTSGISSSCSAWSNSTYTYDGSQWTLQSPATSPSARTDATLTFDPSNNTAVLFGGENSSGALSETWTWNGTTWTQFTGSTHPSARHGAVAAYLPSTGDIYLFGGESGSTYLSDTWKWNGSGWTQLSPSTSPSARALASMAYAGTAGTSANDLLLYGGLNSSGDLDDTWTFDGTTWTSLSLSEGPGPLDSSVLAYDPAMSVPLFYGGEDGSTVDTSLWAWDGSQWIEGGGNEAVDLYGMTMAQDPANGQMMIEGGQYASSGNTNNQIFKVDFINGHPRSGTLFTRNLDDRLTETINPITSDAYLSQTDFNINGVGLPLTLSQNYDMEGGCVSFYLGCNWTAGILDVQALQQPDGHSVVLVMPDGSLNYCPYSGSSWTCPSGSDLSYDGSNIVQMHPQITYHLNSNHQISTIKDRNGDTITVNYSGSSQATSITDTEGRTTSLSYSGGYLQTITDPASRTATFTYSGSKLSSIAVYDPSDSSGTATTSFADLGFGDHFDVTTPAGREDRYETGRMHRVHDVIKVTNTGTGAGDDTNYDYNYSDGEMVETDPLGHTTTYYATNGQITKVVDARTHTQQSTFNAAADPETLTNGLTQVTTLTWDANNNLEQATSPATSMGQNAANSYYSFNTPTSGGGAVTGGAYLPSSATDPQGNCSAFTYDAAGNQTAAYSGETVNSGTTNCDGKTTGTGVTSVTDGYQGDAGVTSCGGKTGELCTTTSGAGNVTTYGYDTDGELTSIVQPGGSCSGTRKLCTTITYDSLSRPSTVEDGKGQVTTYSYDKFDRITQILYNGATTCSFSAGTCIQYGYDADGNVTSREDKSGTTSFTYDKESRLTEEDLPSSLDACSGYSGITFTYDGASNLRTMCDASGTVNYHYNSVNLIDGIGTDGGTCNPGAVVQPCTNYSYDSANELTGITYPTSTGVTDTLGYDDAGHQTSELVKKGSTTLESTAYTYYSGANDTQLQQTAENVVSGVTTSYSYDNLDRLTGANTGTGSTSETYGYDADGNLKTEDLGGTTTTLKYNASDALCWAYVGTSSNSCSSAPSGATTYSYDANGNQTGSSAGESISYNSLNQTTSLTPAGGSALSMAYTGTDSTQRTTAGSTTFANSIFGVASSTTGSTTTYFTSDPTGRLHSILVGSTRYYVYYNGAGSVGGMFDSSGSNVASYSYDPYGTTSTSGSEASADPFRFKGGYQDSTGYYKFGTRYLNTALGSWTQQDSISGTIQNPSAVNRYPYVDDDPVNEIDPTGLCGGFLGCLGHLVAGVEEGVDAIGAATLGVSTIAASGAAAGATGGASVVGIPLGVGVIAGAGALAYSSYDEFSQVF